MTDHTEGRWVMTTQRIRQGMQVYIGAVCIASIMWRKGGNYPKVDLEWNGKSVECANASEAFKLLHAKLRSPPEND